MTDIAPVHIQAARTFAVGTRVEVHHHLVGRWSPGFQVAAVIEERHLIRRLSDGSWPTGSAATISGVRPWLLTFVKRMATTVVLTGSAARRCPAPSMSW